jgi:hypothetical protein
MLLRKRRLRALLNGSGLKLQPPLSHQVASGPTARWRYIAFGRP